MCFLEIEKLDMCLSHEIKSFDLKNIIFLSTKKMVFGNRKIRSIFFICFKGMKKDFLRRKFHS